VCLTPILSLSYKFVCLFAFHHGLTQEGPFQIQAPFSWTSQALEPQTEQISIVHKLPCLRNFVIVAQNGLRHEVYIYIYTLISHQAYHCNIHLGPVTIYKREKCQMF
jgi:hypothetical protein